VRVRKSIAAIHSAVDTLLATSDTGLPGGEGSVLGFFDEGMCMGDQLAKDEARPPGRAMFRRVARPWENERHALVWYRVRDLQEVLRDELMTIRELSTRQHANPLRSVYKSTNGQIEVRWRDPVGLRLLLQGFLGVGHGF
jgi:hypothetical protein